jgi:cell division protein FtsI (penicillin-binding protein 3)
MLEQVVSDGGTGKNVAINGYRVAGKTGTAQVYDSQKGTYASGRFVASFIGIAPAEDPRLVVAVITRTSPQSPSHFGADTSGPVFKEVMAAALQLLKVPPSTTKAPSLVLHAPNSPKVGPWNWAR